MDSLSSNVIELKHVGPFTIHPSRGHGEVKIDPRQEKASPEKAQGLPEQSIKAILLISWTFLG